MNSYIKSNKNNISNLKNVAKKAASHYSISYSKIPGSPGVKVNYSNIFKGDWDSRCGVDHYTANFEISIELKDVVLIEDKDNVYIGYRFTNNPIKLYTESIDVFSYLLRAGIRKNKYLPDFVYDEFVKNNDTAYKTREDIQEFIMTGDSLSEYYSYNYRDTVRKYFPGILDKIESELNRLTLNLEDKDDLLTIKKDWFKDCPDRKMLVLATISKTDGVCRGYSTRYGYSLRDSNYNYITPRQNLIKFDGITDLINGVKEDKICPPLGAIELNVD